MWRLWHHTADILIVGENICRSERVPQATVDCVKKFDDTMKDYTVTIYRKNVIWLKKGVIK